MIGSLLSGPFTVEQAEYAVAAIVGGAAVVEDLARRTISNWLSLAALAGGLGCQVAANGWMGSRPAIPRHRLNAVLPDVLASRPATCAKVPSCGRRENVAIQS